MNKIKENEMKMLEVIKSTQPHLSNLQASKSDTATFDAFNDEYLVELKCRNTHYDDQMIEGYKFKELGMLTHGRGLTALYCTQSPDGTIYIYNLNKLYHEGYDFGWNEQGGLPTTSHFQNRTRKSKVVGHINISKAETVIGGADATQRSDREVTCC